ncbi:MAG: tetratricopeptide repeat protein, partial [Phycisphaerae bacterium]|nr:tetratricopeptide repeat protein [Phycisphaerae bacterium]NIX01530.1 tetratricopeptide repeat protein [Phycisphaerae bacterium]NIX31291.1 tetratricopeptide repeat protein [Phycisphaerae bacterium]
SIWQSNYALLTDAVKKSPENPVLRYNLGVAYGERGMLGEALEEYESAIRLDPSYADAYYNAACIYSRLGDVETG